MKEGSGSSPPGCTPPRMSAQAKKEAEANDSVSNMKTHEEIFGLLPEKEAEKVH